MDFKKWLNENNIDMKMKIAKIIQNIQELDDDDNKRLASGGLFAMQNKKQIMLPFFQEIYNNLPNPELEKRLHDIDNYQSPIEAYRHFNGAGHPVRDWLIINNMSKQHP